MNTKKLIAAAVAVGVLAPSFAHADWRFNGYGTVGATYYDSDNGRRYGMENNYNQTVSLPPNTRFGLRGEYRFSKTLTVEGMTTFRAQDNDYRQAGGLGLAHLFAKKRFSDNFVARLGRLPTNTGVSDKYLHVGQTYPWIFPSEEVYSLTPFHAYEGLDLTYGFKAGIVPLEFTVYGGASAYDEAHHINGLRADTSADFLYGGVLTIPTTFGKFRFHGGKTQMDQTIEDALQGPSGSTTDLVAKGVESNLMSASIIADKTSYIFIGEYARRDVRTGPIKDTESWHVTLGYRTSGSVVPYAYYGDWEEKQSQSEHKRYGLGLKYPINKSVSLKFEAFQVEAEGGPAFFEVYPGTFSSDLSDYNNEATAGDIAVDFAF